MIPVPPRIDVDALVRALEARHGLDLRGGLALRARIEHALAELPAGTAVSPLDAAFVDRLAQLLRVGETRFFRDAAQLDAVTAAVIAPALAAGRCRVLSAGCSTGEEAFSLAMLCEQARGEGQGVWDVVGIDASRDSLAIARAGRYPSAAAAAIPSIARRFVREEGDTVVVDPELRARCHFVEADLLTAPLGGPFHVVLCRNVLIYLADDAALRVLDRLAGALAREGVLVVARAEIPLARRAGLPVVTIGRPSLTVFGARERATAAKKSAASIGHAPKIAPVEDAAPPSRVRIVVDRKHADALVVEGQALLARGAAIVELHVPRTTESIVAIARPLQRLIAAASALGARCVASDARSARLLAEAGVELAR
jgi:chemotaxis protein methyltransferase CheR